MKNLTTARALQLGVAAAAAAAALPVGTAAAHHADGPAEYGVIERQCEAHKGYLFTNTYDGLRLICSGPDFDNGAKPAEMACDRMGGTFTIKSSEDHRSWTCHLPGEG